MNFNELANKAHSLSRTQVNIEPIPECDALIDGKRYKTPGDVAQEMLRECRLWKRNNPGKNVMDIITPDWVKYIKQNL